jgi:hypothetical protein
MKNPTRRNRFFLFFSAARDFFFATDPKRDKRRFFRRLSGITRAARRRANALFRIKLPRGGGFFGDGKEQSLELKVER